MRTINLLKTKGELFGTTTKQGDTIEFYISCNADRKVVHRQS